MGSGLQKSLVPIFVGKGIDTKIDPRLVPEGSLLTLENMYMLRTGELRLRNGFKALSTAYGTLGLDNLFANGASLSSFAGNYQSTGVLHTPVRYLPAGGAASAGWLLSQPQDIFSASPIPVPVATTTISGIEASALSSAVTSNDLVDPDLAIANNTVLATWNEATIAAGQRSQLRSIDGQSLITDQSGGSSSGNGRPQVSCSGGSSYLCTFLVNISAPGSILCAIYPAAANTWTNVTIAAGLVSAAQPWIDAKPIPGGNLIAVAYRANAGGVTCGIFDPATGTLTSTVTTAGADASFCLGWLDDSLATGNMYLATAGSTSGVVVRTMSATTMVVSATNVIDATATANVRQITGHINTSATNYVVLWDVDAAPTYFSKVVRGAWAGAATVFDLACSYGLYSRSFKSSDGGYYFIGSYDSTVQPTYSVISSANFGTRRFGLMGQIMPGYAGGRRAAVSSLASAAVIGAVTYVPLARKQKISTSSGDSLSVRSIVRAAVSISSSGFKRARELGGTFFYPGGIVTRDDGKWTNWAVFPFYPEAPTLVSSATGSMTASGAYAYRVCFRRTDAVGRIARSASSVPATVTLGAGDGRVTLTLQNPRTMPASYFSGSVATENNIVEVYRSGPAAAGSTTYNLVGSLAGDAFGASNTLTFIDTMSDTNAALGEILYSTGNVLENFPSPSCTLLEVNGGRVGIVNSEDQTEFWPSKEYKSGSGLGFNSALSIRVTGDNYGAITALAAMDGRWILFKSQAIYVISGDGPNDLGQGSFNPPQAVSLSIGTVLPGSVVATPDGIMFQSANGIYLLTRGLAVQYVGAPVEKYTLAENVVDASLVTGVTQARFVTASGRCLVWDYHHQRWYTFQLRVSGSTVVACANSSQLGWCYALATGAVLQETPGVFSDVNVTSTAIVPSIGFPQVNAGGIAGFQRCHGILLEGEWVGDHTLQVSAILDLGTVTEPTRSLAITTGPYLYEVMFANQKCTTIQVNLTCTLAAGSGAFRLSGASLIVGLKRGNGIPYTKRLV